MSEIRCFIAVEVDDTTIIRQIQKIQRDLSSSGARLKLVDPENLHFTLHFLGNIDEQRIPELANILNEIEGKSFDVELVGVGCFRPQRPRVIWIGCTTGANQLVNHQMFLGKQLRVHGFPSEKRKYTPHLTIVRVRSGENRAQLMRLVDEHANHNFGTFKAQAIKLKKSTLTPKGPIYDDLAVQQLNEGD
ncbi:MAG: RNA 2',3'-cyclic phosphodiesterase [Promethearchaeota archaeon]